jgi:CxxC motif-containing protein (DUF1111 family)
LGHRIAAALEKPCPRGAFRRGPVERGDGRDDARAARRDPCGNHGFLPPERFEALSGGSATNRSTLNRNAFSQPSANLSFEQRADFFVGKGLFRRNWVTAPSSTQGADGLGPLYNARGCQGCHLKDGRGHPPAGPDDSAVSMFLRLSISAAR